tara:strand:+ start:448 stop:1230 length:783 start_codon:yes stop_codon:yes gene_type:complete
MTNQEKLILQQIDDLSLECVKFIESNYLTIPNIGSLNMDLVVLAFLMNYLLKERAFEGKRMQKFLQVYENHFITNRCNAPRKSTIYNLENEEIDWKNLVAYANHKEMEYAEKKQYFIRTLSNISPDINKFIDSARNYDESSKIHYPFLTLINIYANPHFCYKTPLSEYEEHIHFLSIDIKNSNINLPKFLSTFSKMWIDIISKYFENSYMFIDRIELAFPPDELENKQIKKASTNTKNNSGCLLLFSITLTIITSLILLN